MLLEPLISTPRAPIQITTTFILYPYSSTERTTRIPRISHTLFHFRFFVNERLSRPRGKAWEHEQDTFPPLCFRSTSGYWERQWNPSPPSLQCEREQSLFETQPGLTFLGIAFSLQLFFSKQTFADTVLFLPDCPLIPSIISGTICQLRTLSRTLFWGDRIG